MLFQVGVTKKLGDISLKRKDQAKNVCSNEKIGEIVVQMPSDQLSQRLLTSVVRGEAPLLEIFSHERSGVAPSLFHDYGEMRKTKQN